MSFQKKFKDRLIRFLLGKNSVPSGLAELHHYFRSYGPIQFRYEKQEDGSFIAVSENFRHGSIVTHAGDRRALDGKIEDAILTAFEVPSSYASDAAVHRVDEKEYAFA